MKTDKHVGLDVHLVDTSVAIAEEGREGAVRLYGTVRSDLHAMERLFAKLGGPWNAPAFLRQTFVEWAGESVVHCAWAKAYYRQQRRAGKRHQAILRALAFKWIRILWRCWYTRTPYDDHRYTEARRRRHSPLALALEKT